MDLVEKAKEFRNEVLELIFRTKKGHIGGDYSEMEILVSLFYNNILQFDPKNPKWEERDRFILSKGHACAPYYMILHDLGYFSSSENYAPNGIPFEHPTSTVPGIEINGGSLGHGVGVGTGMALAGKLNKKSYNVVVLVGDGECYEGSLWESANLAAHLKLNNLFVVVDRNHQITLDTTENCNVIEPFAEKWKSFGWEVREVSGHSFVEIKDAFKDFRNRVTDKPLVIIAETIKGKGVSFMENIIGWHHKVPNKQEYEIAKRELNGS